MSLSRSLLYFCASVSLGSLELRHLGATAGQCLSGKSAFGKGVSGCQGPGLSPRVGQLAQGPAAGHRVSLRLGRVDLKLRSSSRSLPNQDSGQGGGSGPRMEGAVRSPGADPPMGYGSSSSVDPRAESLGWASPFPSCFWRSGGVGSAPQGCGWAQSPTEKR